MSGHTPGTWIAQADPDGSSDDWMVGLSDGKPDQIAVCSKRDAHILAAAPDLLAVVLELEESAGYWSEYDVPLGIVDRIRAAISKARGEKP